MHRASLATLCAVAIAACSPGGGGTASAHLESRSGTQVTGTATFTEKDGKVDIILNGKALPVGHKHGVYIHEKGDCTGSNAAAVGNRFMPAGDERGGVVGDIEPGPDGNGSLVASLDKITVSAGENSIMNRSIVISSDPDNPQIKQTFGIIACGVIGPPEE